MFEARHAQLIQNNKFAVCLQYLSREVSEEVDFWHSGKYEHFLQTDIMIFHGDSQAFPNFPK